jgi:AcrR family transcriptional regulator
VHDDAHIMAVTLQLLKELGYQQMGLGDVAERSGVSRPTLYLRWQNKAELVAAAIQHAHRSRPKPTGELRADLIAEVRDVRNTYAAVADMGMVGVLLSEERRHPEFIGAWREKIVGPRRAGVEAILQRGIDAGEVRVDASPRISAQILLGAFYSAYLAGNPMDDGWDEEVVDTVLRGLVTGS